MPLLKALSLAALAGGLTAAEGSTPATGAFPAAPDPADDAGLVLVQPVRPAAAAPAIDRRPPVQERPWFSGGGSLSAGYDDNVLFESSNNPVASEQGATALGADLRLQARLADGPRGRFALQARGGINDFPTMREAQTIWGGAGCNASWSLGWAEAGASFEHSVWLRDREVVARVDSVRPWLVASDDRRQVGVVQLAAQRIRFDDEDASGTLWEAGYRHWLLLAEGNLHRRLELGARVGTFRAGADDETYNAAIPGLGLFWRIGGSRPELGTTDLSLGTQLELRRYADGLGLADPRRQEIWQANAGADYWLCGNASLGLYGLATRRLSDLDTEVYTRFQYGLRLNVTW